MAVRGSTIALGLAFLVSASFAVNGATAKASAAPDGVAAPDAERVFAQARNAWEAREEAPFVSYGILLRMRNGPYHWDNWWEAYYRKSDQRFIARRIVIAQDDEKRLKGIPLCLPFGLKILDTNPAAEPIYVEDPTIAAAESFGLLRSNASRVSVEEGDAGPSDVATAPQEIGRVQTVARDYAVRFADPQDDDQTLYHLVLTPLHDPGRLRLRELWVSKDTFVTRKLVVEGISDGEPYNRARWIASYTELAGRTYLRQIKSEAPLHFGLTSVQTIEFDFVDFRFPQEIPHYLFARAMSSRHTRPCGP